MKKSPLKRRNKLLQMYRAKLQKVPYALYKIDYPMLNILYDQYHQAMKMLDEEQKEEDRILAEFNLRQNKKGELKRFKHMRSQLI